jgi:hypothetical protein
MAENSTARFDDAEIRDLLNPCPPFPREVIRAQRRWMKPYHDLEVIELRRRQDASAKYVEGFESWLGQLALFSIAFNRSYVLPEGDEPDDVDVRQSIEFRLDLLGLAGDNFKLTLDATLAGYYSPALAVVRHLLETWLRTLHTRLCPQEVWRWYPEHMWADHARKKSKAELPREPPKADHIASIVYELGSERDKKRLTVVRKGFNLLNDHAHPTVEGATQTWTGPGGRQVFGPTFSDPHCLRCLKWGLIAGVLLLGEIEAIDSQIPEWDATFHAFDDPFEKWLEEDEE